MLSNRMQADYCILIKAARDIEKRNVALTFHCINVREISREYHTTPSPSLLPSPPLTPPFEFELGVVQKKKKLYKNKAEGCFGDWEPDVVAHKTL